MGIRKAPIRRQLLRAAGAAAIMAALSAVLGACRIAPAPPQERAVSANVYGRGIESVTGDVYAPGPASGGKFTPRSW
ncbi:hypothetical protein [Cohnella thermotolerans]|uniref:hypothetical protein n=1 Tax=Cohnella thermotolerans TaxID=329858 RepID=UPI00047BDEEA|nr:hypothetical protein [Cohnella thermotolerans]